jgi:hypothetical protein
MDVVVRAGDDMSAENISGAFHQVYTHMLTYIVIQRIEDGIMTPWMD